MITFPPPLFHSTGIVTPWSADSIGVEIVSGVHAVPTSAAWSGNQASYFPWYVSEPCSVTEVIWQNGASVAGNVAIGIYRSTSGLVPDTKVVSSTLAAQSGTNVTQTAALTDTVITPGLYWIAHYSTSGSATFFRTALGTIAVVKSMGVCSETVATDLPATATPVSAAHTGVPVFGIILSPRTLA